MGTSGCRGVISGCRGVVSGCDGEEIKHHHTVSFSFDFFPLLINKRRKNKTLIVVI